MEGSSKGSMGESSGKVQNASTYMTSCVGVDTGRFERHGLTLVIDASSVSSMVRVNLAVLEIHH